ncbi:LLM class flavin-dependent oxidoreductase [Solirubrobacter soli]|uniref:LLM class flavin-dependent oxidoreductase n=1 Tax=Solirubrobacter soli TaxID=363832 RepID=UPI00042724D6|nr:LLM class flavin-dependent oxidoreductase [Solirubrobacter soli]
MRVGVSPWGTSLAGVKRVAAAAEAARVDTLWLGDGLLVVPDFPQWSGGLEPFAELAWLAGRHPSLAIGVGAAVLPLRDPLYVAKQAATLDQLTEGRFFLVVTPGIWEREFAFRGLSFKARGTRFDEFIRVVRAAFAGEPFAGEQVTLPPDGRLSPVPFTVGGPPLWLAGGRPTFERALRHGLGFQARTTPPSAFAATAREWFDRGGGDLAMRIALQVADAVVESDDALAGPPAYLTEQLAAYRDLGLADVSLMPGRDDATSLRTLEALAEEILPALR